MHPVTGAFTEGSFSAITQSVRPGDRVVTDGQDKLQPGTRVEVRGGGQRPEQAQTNEGQAQ